MRMNEVKLFLYTLQMLFKDTFDQKKIIFDSDKGFISANFYTDNSSLFKTEELKISFRKHVIDTFLRDIDFSDKKVYLSENKHLAVIEVQNFIRTINDEYLQNTNVIFDVDFLNHPSLSFPFLIVSESSEFIPVSFIPDDI